MDVRCKLLGHVHDSTEFEDRRADRPRGTVLICREYQVCRRCGDRKEMYRNEEVLSRDPDKAASEPGDSAAEPEAHTDDDGAGAAPESDTDPAGSLTETTDSGEQSPQEDPTAVTEASGVDDSPSTGTDQPPDGVKSAAETGRDVDSEDPDDADSVTDDGVILSGTSTEPETRADDPAKQPVADGRGATDNDLHEAESSPSMLDLDTTSGGRVYCADCSGEWQREATSLRDGDICPDCRRAYVESA